MDIMLKRILMLASIGLALVFGMLAGQQLLFLLGGSTVEHLLQHAALHSLLIVTFAPLSALSGVVSYRLRRTR